MKSKIILRTLNATMASIISKINVSRYDFYTYSTLIKNFKSPEILYYGTGWPTSICCTNSYYLIKIYKSKS